VTRQGQRQIVRRNATAVVAHSQQLDPALLNVHIDASRARIQTVFQQLLDHRGRALHHLAGGNLIRQPRT